MFCAPLISLIFTKKIAEIVYAIEQVNPKRKSRIFRTKGIKLKIKYPLRIINVITSPNENFI